MRVLRDAAPPASTAAMLWLIILLSAGCVSTPRAQSPDSPPAWVTSPPAGDATYEYFVGSASDTDRDQSRAEEQAVYSLIAGITRFMGVRVTAETTSQARAGLDSFQAELIQQVRQTSAARIAGFRVSDRYVEHRPDRVTVYLLARYERTELLKERERIAALFREQADALAVPERRGRELEAAGELFKAALSYINAATAAATSTVDNAAIVFERNINNARNALSAINLEPLSGRLSGSVGLPFAEPFRLRVTAGPGARPLAGVPVAVSFRELRTGGRLSVREVILQSNEDGLVEFNHPAPTFVGAETLSMMLHLAAYLDPLQQVGRSHLPLVQGLEDMALSKRVRFDYVVESRSRDVQMGVVILDMDRAGQPTGGSVSASGVIEGLSADGFRIRSIGFDAARLKSAGDAQIIDALRSGFGTQVERVVFGTIAIDEFESDASGVTVRVSGTLKVAELASGELLYSRRLFKRSRASSSDSAVQSAFRSLGLDFGRDISRNLP